MHIFFLIQLCAGCNYSIDPGSDCVGKDTRTVLGEFSMIWIWIAVTISFIFGLIISIIRDIVPRPQRTDTSERYYTGESKSIIRFLIEEYLLTGWIVSKNQRRFTNTSRWCIIILIIYTEMFITGAFYERDYENPQDFVSRDFIYGLIATVITFFFYLSSYYLLVIRLDDYRITIKRIAGYALVGIMSLVCLIFVFIFTYQMHDDTDVNYTRLVDHWLSAFGYSLLMEVLVSENIRIVTRAVLIWSKRFNPEEPMQTNIEMSYVEKRKYTIESED